MGMERQAALDRVEAWVRETLDANTKRGHGWLHTDRVRCTIRVLARAESVDPFLAELAALLHDVGRTQAGPEAEHGARSAVMAAPILEDLSLTHGEREAVLHAIRWHNSIRDDTALLCVLRDADMLDGLGAMGIIRAFMSKSHLLPYDPEAPFEDSDDRWPPLFSSDQFLGQMAWYDRLNTETARQMAEDRFALMRAFRSQARREAGANDG
jgi:HD superfamily phosphodiesterase